MSSLHDRSLDTIDLLGYPTTYGLGRPVSMKDYWVIIIDDVEGVRRRKDVFEVLKSSLMSGLRVEHIMLLWSSFEQVRKGSC